MDVGPHGSAFDAAGLVTCWGEHGEDRLSLAGETGMQVITASLFTCLLDEGGAVRCEGDDTYGQFRVPRGGCTSSAAGDHHACGVTDKSTVDCLGQSDDLEAFASSAGYRPGDAGPARSCAVEAQGAERC